MSAERAPASRQPCAASPSSPTSRGRSKGSQRNSDGSASAGTAQLQDAPLQAHSALEELAAAAGEAEARAGARRQGQQQGQGRHAEPAPKRQRLKPMAQPLSLPPAADSPPPAATPVGPQASARPTTQAQAACPPWPVPAQPCATLGDQAASCAVAAAPLSAATAQARRSAFSVPDPRAPALAAACAAPPAAAPPQLQLLQQLLSLAPAPAPPTPVVPAPSAQAPGLLSALSSAIGAVLQVQQQAAEQQRQAAEQQRQAAEQQEGMLRLLFQLAAPTLPPQLLQLQQPSEPTKPLQAAVQLLLQGLAGSP